MHFDHIVVHIDNDKKLLENLKEKIVPLGFPFEPKKGKGTSGFQAANIWIGRQYFEIIRLINSNGGGWTPHWVERYKKGVRGTYCIFMLCSDIDKVSQSLRINGIQNAGPERITFKSFFGLFKKTLPWQLIYLPPIPGTNLEIGFIQYDPDPDDWIKQFLVPNSDEMGIDGIDSVSLGFPLSEEAKTFLKKIFPDLENTSTGARLSLDRGGSLLLFNSPETKVKLHCKTSDGKKRNSHFEFMDIEVEV